MRVIAGEAKGLCLKWPKEPHIRPTSDMIRGAIFSALESLEADWSRVLDLYAGTGALGIEALSRGAGEADFVERHPKCCGVIKENLIHTGLAERAGVYRLEARKALQTLKGQYSIIFIDPPYADEQEQAILDEVSRCDLVTRQTTVVMEHSKRFAPPTVLGEFRLIKSLRHGDTCISIYQCEGGNN